VKRNNDGQIEVTILAATWLEKTMKNHSKKSILHPKFEMGTP